MVSGGSGPGVTSLGAIVINAAGERFADESMGPSEFGAFVLAQPGGWAIELYDEAMHAQVMRLGPYREAVERGCVIAAPDVASLAAAFDLPAEAVSRTLAAYHDAHCPTRSAARRAVRSCHPTAPPKSPGRWPIRRAACRSMPAPA